MTKDEIKRGEQAASILATAPCTFAELLDVAQDHSDVIKHGTILEDGSVVVAENDR